MIEVDSAVYNKKINIFILLYLDLKNNRNIAINSYDCLRELFGERLCDKILGHVSHMFIGSEQVNVKRNEDAYQLFLYVDGNDFIVYSNYTYFVSCVNKYIANKAKVTNGLKNVIICQGVYRDYTQDNTLLSFKHKGIVSDDVPHDTIMIYEKCVKVIRSNGDYLEYDSSGVKRLIIGEEKKDKS